VSLDEAIALMKQHTRNYAKRQMTWLRREDHWTWVRPEEAVKKILDVMALRDSGPGLRRDDRPE
jgi:tRNA dimethylallyltransferase